jgi:hypothetical protein
MNWALFALSIAGVMTGIWILVLVKSRRSFMSIYVSFAFLLLAAMNSAAPIRGYVDPNYVGYGFGLLHATRGLSVTLMAGGVFLIWQSLRSSPRETGVVPGCGSWLSLVPPSR